MRHNHAWLLATHYLLADTLPSIDNPLLA
eukprot:COSAG03_NODE_10634_length_638_cov_0.827458_1_plen_28_part_01